MIKYIIIILFILYFTVEIFAGSENFIDVSWKEDWRINKNLNYPVSLYINNDKIFIFDMKAKDKPILVFDTTGHYLTSFGKWGKGPGELSSQGSFIVGFLYSNIVVLGQTERKLVFYNLNTFDFEREINIAEYGLPLNIAFYKNKMFLIKGNFDPWFIEVFEINNDLNIKKLKSNNRWGYYDKIPELNVATKNYLLKQGKIIIDNEGNLFYSFEKSSMVIGFTKSGQILFKTLQPSNIELPDYISETPGRLMSPPINYYPETNIAIGVDKKYLYTVFSGFKLGKVISKRLLKDLPLGQGKILNVFDKINGNYKFSIKLPFLIERIFLTDNALYVLSLSPEIALVKFFKPEELR